MARAKYKDKWPQAIAYKVLGNTWRDIAKWVKVSERAIYKWEREDDEFKALLEEAREDALEAHIDSALRVLGEKLDSEEEQIQIAAARELLKHRREMRKMELPQKIEHSGGELVVRFKREDEITTGGNAVSKG